MTARSNYLLPTPEMLGCFDEPRQLHDREDTFSLAEQRFG
jgi:hypothetical protein